MTSQIQSSTINQGASIASSSLLPLTGAKLSLIQRIVNENLSPLCGFLNEMWLHIFSFLPQKDVLNCTLVCKLFCKIVHGQYGNSLWQHFYMQTMRLSTTGSCENKPATEANYYLIHKRQHEFIKSLKDLPLQLAASPTATYQNLNLNWPDAFSDSHFTAFTKTEGYSYIQTEMRVITVNLKTLAASSTNLENRSLGATCFTASEQYFFVANDGGQISSWHKDGKKAHDFANGQTYITCLLSYNHYLIVGANSDQMLEEDEDTDSDFSPPAKQSTVRIWNLQSKSYIDGECTEEITSLAAQQGSFFCGTKNGEIYQLSFNGDLVRSFKTHTESILCLLPTHEFLFATSEDGRVAQIDLSQPLVEASIMRIRVNRQIEKLHVYGPYLLTFNKADENINCSWSLYDMRTAYAHVCSVDFSVLLHTAYFEMGNESFSCLFDGGIFLTYSSKASGI